MDNTKIDLHLCAGYDGIGRGLELAGVEPPIGTIYVEIETYACANLVAKIEEGTLGPAVCHSDLKNFPYQDLAGRVRLLTAGFPCQPFSAAGKRQGTEDPRHLWPHIARGISQCRPDTIFCENVEGIISSKTADGQSVLQHVLESLEQMGYRAEAGIFSAEEVGAPHRRRRVYILGHRVADSNGGGHQWGEERLPDCERGLQESSKGLRPDEESEFKGHNRRRENHGDSPELAHTNSSRGREDQLQSELRTGGIEQPSSNRWPSRPQEAQQEWEAPRVIHPQGDLQGGGPKTWGTPRSNIRPSHMTYDRGKGNLEEQVGASVKGGGKLNPDWVEQLMGLPVGWTGTGSRTDRLRLLGNGVVPQTAAKAWEVLNARLA